MSTPQDAVEMSSAEDAGRSSAESNVSVLETSQEKISKNHVAVAVDEQQPPYLAAYRQPSKGPSTFQMHGMTVTLQDVTYSVQIPDKENSKLFRKKKVDKTLLDGITCSFVPNRLVALMGSSGAGTCCNHAFRIVKLWYSKTARSPM
jgi:ABC-type multidrug transport system fused ATPase/permease subunit